MCFQKGKKRLRNLLTRGLRLEVRRLCAGIAAVVVEISLCHSFDNSDRH